MNRARLALLILLLTLLLAGLWTYRRVEMSLRELRAAGLTTLLHTQTEALDLWISERMHEVARSAADARLRAHLEPLLAMPESAALRNMPAHQALARLLTNRDGEAVVAQVVDLRGRIMTSQPAADIGRPVPPDVAKRLMPVFEGETRFIPPVLEETRPLPPEPGRLDRPLIWVAAPVRNEQGKIIAALRVAYPANQAFADILKLARPGRTGEAYAFDANGFMLTESRYPGLAAERGLAPADAGDSSILALQLREPPTQDNGGEGFRPPTRLAAAAIAARNARSKRDREGVLLDPYLNYVGNEVIGAWRWMSRFDMGVALELEAREAYAPLHYVNIGVAALLTILMGVWLSVFVSPRRLAERWRSNRPQMIGPYLIERQIGEGAISNVYLARHQLLKRPVAMKVLKIQSTTDEWTARFKREVELASRLRHPNTIAIHDFGEGSGGRLYYVMEYLEGLSLADLVERYGAQPATRTAYLLRQVCDSLAEAHQSGIVHRDIKPQNIMTCRIGGRNDVAKVLDFGLVKRLDATDTRDLTSSLRMLGTPLYMAPERIRDPSHVDGRTDIYSLGAVGFYLLTGKRLFHTESDHDLTYQILHTAPPRASEHTSAPIPRELDDLLVRCLSKDPAQRPATAGEVAHVLDQVLAAHPWTPRQIDEWWRLHWVDESHPERRVSIR